MEIDLRIKGGFKAASEARHSLGDLSGHVSDDAFDNIVLLLNELVTNAIRHGMIGSSDEIEITIRLDEAIVRVEVLDRGTGTLVEAREPSLQQESGWGLNIVAGIADRWGFEQNGSTQVWFEIDL